MNGFVFGCKYKYFKLFAQTTAHEFYQSHPHVPYQTTGTAKKHLDSFSLRHQPMAFQNNWPIGVLLWFCVSHQKTQTNQLFVLPPSVRARIGKTENACMRKKTYEIKSGPFNCPFFSVFSSACVFFPGITMN